MKIIYIKKEEEGNISEEIHINISDVRYPTVGVDVQMSLQTAVQLVSELSKKLSNIPY